MLFLYAGTCLTVILGLSSLSGDLPYLRLLGIAVLFGLWLSWRQHQSNKRIPHLKTTINILLVILTIRALLPFFIQSKDILTGLIQAWIFFLILSTFTIYSKRDHYLVQTLALGAIVFSCLSQTAKASIALNYILAFFIIWITALRAMSLLQDIKETKDIIKTRGWFYRELKITAMFICIVAISTLPLYLYLPRLNLPIPFISRLLEQKYAAAYADYPKNDLMSFLSSSKQQVVERKQEEPDDDAAASQESLQKLIELDKQKTGPRFYHSAEEYENKLKELEEQSRRLNQEIEETDRQLAEIREMKSISGITALIQERQRLKLLQQELENNKQQLEKEKAGLREKYLKSTQQMTAASLNEPQNQGLLEKLDKEMKSVYEKLQSKINTLKTVSEGLGITRARIDEIHRQWSETNIGTKIHGLLSKKEELEGSLEPVENQLKVLQNDYERFKMDLAAIEQARQEAEAEEQPAPQRLSILDLLTRILISILALVAVYLVIHIAAFFISFIKHKLSLSRALKRNYRLFIILIYNFLSRMLTVFGCRRRVAVTPQEYSIILNKKFRNIKQDIDCLTCLFLEARYSSHTITNSQAKQAQRTYLDILRKLRRKASLLKRIFLSLG